MQRLKVSSYITGREGVATPISGGWQVVDMGAENVVFFSMKEFNKRFKIHGNTNLNPTPDWVKPDKKAEKPPAPVQMGLFGGSQ
jgi:hypothetical protein